MIPSDLAAAWRDRAGELRRYGAEAQAVTLEAAAEELDAALREAADQALTLSEGAEESGYSERRLRELVSEGKVPMAPGGRKGRPRIRRADLPRKPKTGGSNGYDPAADAAALVGRIGGAR